MIIFKDKFQREEYGCIASIDIGAYYTCMHDCIYCYANYDSNIVRINYSSLNPNSPILFGEIGPKDKSVERKVVTCKIYQHTFL